MVSLFGRGFDSLQLHDFLSTKTTIYQFMNQDVDNQKQKARLALILKTGRVRLWFYYPATRHYCYLSESGDYENEFNPS